MLFLQNKQTRRMKLYFTLIVAAFLSCACPMRAQGIVTLDSCRSLALGNNKLLRAAEENIAGAGYARKAAKAAYLPAVDLTAGYMWNQHKINLLGEDAKLPTMIFDPTTQSYKYDLLLNEGGQPIVDPTTGSPIPKTIAVIPKSAMSYDVHNVFAGAVTVTQPVYMGGAIRAMNEITKYAEDLARTSRNSAAQEVVYAVDETYWLVVSLVQKCRLAEKYSLLCDSLRYSVNQMYDQGIATKSDCLRVEVKYNESRVALVKAQNGLTLSRMALAQICGLPINTAMTLADEGLDNLVSEAADVALAASDSADLRDVYLRRQDLASLRNGIKLLESNEKLVKADMLPKIAIIGAYKVMNPNMIDGFENRFGGGFNLGATFTMPIWHWGGKRNKLKAAQSATIASRLQYEDAEEKVGLQVQQARFKYQEAYKTLEMTESNLVSANENLDNATYGFKEGVLTTDDVIAAQTAWLQAHSEKIDAQIDVRLCRVYLGKVLGTMNY